MPTKNKGWMAVFSGESGPNGALIHPTYDEALVHGQACHVAGSELLAIIPVAYLEGQGLPGTYGNGFKVGDRVAHRAIGKGTVAEFANGRLVEAGAGGLICTGSIVIDFDNIGRKELLLEFAATSLVKCGEGE